MVVDLGKELKKVGAGLLLAVIFIALITIFDLKWYQSWIMISLFILGFMIWKKQFTVKEFVKNSGTVLVLFLTLHILSGYGFWGYTIGVVGIIIYILLKRRRQFLHAKHSVEEMLWGKPLKEFIKNKEELPKLKISGIRRHKKTNQPQSE